MCRLLLLRWWKIFCLRARAHFFLRFSIPRPPLALFCSSSFTHRDLFSSPCLSTFITTLFTPANLLQNHIFIQRAAVACLFLALGGARHFSRLALQWKCKWGILIYTLITPDKGLLRGKRWCGARCGEIALACRITWLFACGCLQFAHTDLLAFASFAKIASNKQAECSVKRE